MKKQLREITYFFHQSKLRRRSAWIIFTCQDFLQNFSRIQKSFEKTSRIERNEFLILENREEVKNREITWSPYCWHPQCFCCWCEENYPTHRLYFGEVETPYRQNSIYQLIFNWRIFSAFFSPNKTTKFFSS